MVCAIRARQQRRIPRIIGWNLVYPALAAGLIFALKPAELPLLAQIILSLVLVVPLGPMTYRLAFQPLAEASVLVLLIVAVGVHFAMVGLGLLFFGAEGSRTPAFSDGSLSLGSLTVNAQTLWVLGSSLCLIVVLAYFFERTIYGKALRATAMNRTGARLMGISTVMAGKLSRLRIIGLSCDKTPDAENSAARSMGRLAHLNRVSAINTAGVRSH